MSKYTEQIFFVGNLKFDATEDDLAGVFRDNGYKVGTAKVARDKVSEKSMGFGFVTILVDDGDDPVKSMYGAEVNGRPIRVALSTSTRAPR